jgi:polar amino acid transport system permease protein
MHDFVIVFQHLDQFVSAIAITVGITGFGAFVSVLLGSLLTVIWKSAGRTLAACLQVYVDIFRCIPFLLLLYLLYYCLPKAGVSLNSWWTGLLAIALYNTAYMAEIFRGAWNAIDPGTIEAGRAIGFRPTGLYRRIIFPQIIYSSTSVIGNQFIQIVKDSAFLTTISVMEITHAASDIQARYFVPFASFVTAALFYWTICKSIELLVLVVENRGGAYRK